MMKIKILFLITFLSSCSYFGDRVEQEVSPLDLPALCNSGKCFVTYVWYGGEIVASFYDDVPALTDSIVISRQQQAQKILDALKKSK